MRTLIWSGVGIVCGSIFAVFNHKWMGRASQNRKGLEQSVLPTEVEDDTGLETLIPELGFVQQDPMLRELQALIMAADEVGFKHLFAETGTRHPDAMMLDRGLTPLLLAAYVHVRSQEDDRRLKEIMSVLVQRGAHVTQRAEWTGATVMHLLAYHPYHYSVMHRIRFLIDILEEYRNGTGPTAPPPGLLFDPILNGTLPAGGSGDTFGISMHLLGMRCFNGMLPEDLAPPGDRLNLLRERRLMLPACLQGDKDEAEAESP